MKRITILGSGTFPVLDTSYVKPSHHSDHFKYIRPIISNHHNLQDVVTEATRCYEYVGERLVSHFERDEVAGAQMDSGRWHFA